ncbi:hypothetical protein C1565_22650 [Salmonella enterica subsp. enterica serovar Enteritidis]|nr:hypothetical protein [Salmonella enterica subsp. enterica serovar Enteritidis]
MNYGYKNLLSNEEKDFYQEKFEKALEDLLEKKNKEIKEEFEKITNDFILEKIDEEDLGDRHNLFIKEYFALRGIFENVFNDRINKNRW